jgi:hypothetical protein
MAEGTGHISMIRQNLLATTILVASASAAIAQTCQSAVSAGAGAFNVANGQIIGPNGIPFIPKGINIYADQLLANGAGAVTSTFPGINFIRVNVFDLNADSAQVLAPVVSQLTTQGVVVELEDHNYPTILTGSNLTAAANWYTSLATAFKGNTNVIFGTQNEPDASQGTGAVDNEISTIYGAIRGTGNNTIILMDPSGGFTTSGLNPSVYARMTNVAWDLHYYNWMANDSTDLGANQSALASEIAGAQSIQGANGTIPVVIGEYGISSGALGAVNDPGGMQVTQAVDQSGFGSAAWAWTSGDPSFPVLLNDPGGNPALGLTPFGQAVAQHIGECGTPAPIVTTQPEESISVASDTPKVTDVQAVQAPANQPQASQQPDPVIDQNPPELDDVIAAAPAPVVLPQNSPDGDAPTLTPPPGVSELAANGFTQLSGDDGNHTISVSNQGNVIAETCGFQQVSVAGDNNAIDLGPYDDTITLAGTGNTVNAGGGVNHIALAYSGTPAADDLGNVIILPSPGLGEDIIAGKLRNIDRIDLTQALAGTTWDHTAATIADFYTASTTEAGYVIKVDHKVIALFTDGAPGNDITKFVTAH